MPIHWNIEPLKLDDEINLLKSAYKKLEEVIESCDNNTVIGYMITDESTEVH